MKNRKIKLLSLFFDDLTFKEAADICIEAAIRKDKHFTVVTPNLEILLRAAYDTELKENINNASLVVCDGAGVVLFSKIMSFFNCKKQKIIREKIPGIDLGEEVLELAEKNNLSCFFLGGSENTAKNAAKLLKERYKALTIGGYCNGYSELKDADRLISKSDPDIVFVCLGSPLQEKTAHALSGNRLYMCLGGSLDVWADNVKRAPLFMQKYGLEWLYRFYKQPQRILRSAKVFTRACAYIFIYNKI